MTSSAPLCPTCGQPTTLGFADTGDGWECRNEACPEFGQIVAPEGPVDDAFDLQRFVEAQDSGATYEHALAELRAGRKTGHWMWFVFPQIAGLGRSPAAQRYAISSLEEAQAYLAHPILGDRLRACARTLAELEGDRDAEEILGGIDAVKLRSSMTLFARAAPDEPVFGAVLDRYYGGAHDEATVTRL
jgi:uncharacterized protein (DUF1810 family)